MASGAATPIQTVGVHQPASSTPTVWRRDKEIGENRRMSSTSTAAAHWLTNVEGAKPARAVRTAGARRRGERRPAPTPDATATSKATSDTLSQERIGLSVSAIARCGWSPGAGRRRSRRSTRLSVDHSSARRRSACRVGGRASSPAGVVATVDPRRPAKERSADHPAIPARFEIAINLTDVKFPILVTEGDRTRSRTRSASADASAPRRASGWNALSRRAATVRSGRPAVHCGRRPRDRRTVGLTLPSGAPPSGDRTAPTPATGSPPAAAVSPTDATTRRRFIAGPGDCAVARHPLRYC